MGSLSVVVASHNSGRYLERCLGGVVGRGHDVILVDNASVDGTVALARKTFRDVTIVELEKNLGYGAANNVGIARTSGEYVLVLNPDAWPVGDALERLLDAARLSPSAGIVGPRLVDLDGKQEQSVRGFPTLWRLATQYFFLRWLAPRSNLMNAFYGAGVDPAKPGDVEWVVGAALLIRRKAFEEAGGFDDRFFMYDDEVDLAYRLRSLGWQVVYCPEAEFVHVGGGSTRVRATEMYREQLRSHIRFIDKHRGRRQAEHARRMLATAMRLRAVVFRGERRRISADAGRWLASHHVETLLRAPEASGGRSATHVDA